MPTNLNTQHIIDTLREQPCFWHFTPQHKYGWSPDQRADVAIYSKSVTMMAVFSPDLPEHVAVRNMNYLLAFIAAAGAPDALDWVLGRVKQALAADTYRRSIVVNQLHIYLQIYTQRSLTTITVRPCNARVYDV